MAQFKVFGDGTFASQMRALESKTGLAEKMLKAGAPILEKELKERIGWHKRTGITVESVKTSPVRSYGKGGKCIKVYPEGVSTEMINNKGKRHKRRKEVRTGEIAAYLEYGTSREPEFKVISSAAAASGKEVREAMQQVFKNEVGG